MEKINPDLCIAANISLKSKKIHDQEHFYNNITIITPTKRKVSLGKAISIFLLIKTLMLLVGIHIMFGVLNVSESGQLNFIASREFDKIYKVIVTDCNTN